MESESLDLLIQLSHHTRQILADEPRDRDIPHAVPNRSLTGEIAMDKI